jgi:hypothetical protein
MGVDLGSPGADACSAVMAQAIGGSAVTHFVVESSDDASTWNVEKEIQDPNAASGNPRFYTWC